MSETPRLTLTQLATLVEFGRRGTLAQAAEALKYTPGAVSQHISALERAVDAKLVEKVGRQLKLTDAGHMLLQHATALLRAERDAIRAVASLDDRVAGTLTVGTWGSTAVTLMAPVVRAMTANYPHVEILSREVDLDDAASSVRHGTVDVAFALDYVDAPLPRHMDVSMVELLEEEFAIAVGDDLVDHDSTWVEVAELAELEWILPPPTSQYGDAMRAGLRNRGVEPRVVHEVTDTAASLQLAAAGLGATVMTPLMRRLNPQLAMRALRMRTPMTRRVVLLSLREHQQRAVGAFSEIVAGIVAELLAGEQL